MYSAIKDSDARQVNVHKGAPSAGSPATVTKTRFESSPSPGRIVIITIIQNGDGHQSDLISSLERSLQKNTKNSSFANTL